MNTFILFIIFTPILVLSLLLINFIVAISQPDSEKCSPFECGINPLGDSRQKFSVQFFLVAILFLIFDLEVIFLFPFAVSLFHISFYGFWISIIFLIILTIGFVFEFSIGALKFHNPDSSSSNSNSPPQLYLIYHLHPQQLILFMDSPFDQIPLTVLLLMVEEKN